MLWAPSGGSSPTAVKVLSYNLFWWSLFKNRKGNDNSAGKLILSAMGTQPFDFMGFQECENIAQVLTPVGLAEDYGMFGGGHAICMAYRKASWTLLEHGQQDVAEDMPTRYYGSRATQWMRVKHVVTGATAMFLNHHGPLSVNSGGVCGGSATAANLMNVMATHGKQGDLLILVGDFNANAASLTIQGLWPHLTHVFNGDSFGGVDNIFSNLPSSGVAQTADLGSGGSDHTAIAAVLSLAPQGHDISQSGGVGGGPTKSVAALMGPGTSGDDWQFFWCGRMESNREYIVQEGSPASAALAVDAADPDKCCRACQREPSCASWLWRKEGPSCQLRSGAMTGSKPADGVVSGLPIAAAAGAAAAAAGSLSGRMVRYTRR